MGYLKAGGIEKISRRWFYTLGGFSNPKLFRKQRGASWAYYKDNRS